MGQVTQVDRLDNDKDFIKLTTIFLFVCTVQSMLGQSGFCLLNYLIFLKCLTLFRMDAESVSGADATLSLNISWRIQYFILYLTHTAKLKISFREIQIHFLL